MTNSVESDGTWAGTKLDNFTRHREYLPAECGSSFGILRFDTRRCGLGICHFARRLRAAGTMGTMTVQAGYPQCTQTFVPR